MSRIGKNPVIIPKNVQVSVQDDTISVKGPLGSLSQKVPQNIKLTVESDKIILTRPSDQIIHKQLHGLARSLIANMVKGVTEGFSKTLTIEGVGYKAELKNKVLVLQLGFSHPVEFKVPEGIDIKMDGQTKIIVSGISKQQVGEVSAELRDIKKPEPYKGKGIRYSGEYVKKKVGKTGVAGGTGVTK